MCQLQLVRSHGEGPDGALSPSSTRLGTQSRQVVRLWGVSQGLEASLPVLAKLAEQMASGRVGVRLTTRSNSDGCDPMDTLACQCEEPGNANSSASVTGVVEEVWRSRPSLG